MHMRFIKRLVPLALIGLSCLATAAAVARQDRPMRARGTSRLMKRICMDDPPPGAASLRSAPVSASLFSCQGGVRKGR